MSNFKIELIPVFNDNYIFLLYNESSKKALVVDPGESQAAIKVLKKLNLQIESILITHHHSDHIDGLQDLIDFAAQPILVFAPEKNKSQITQATNFVNGGDHIQALGLTWNVLDLPGHTIGHIAFYSDQLSSLFLGDVLFGLGCGRLFEGSYEQSWGSLQMIKSLPAHTKIYCAHEYTEANLKFCHQLVQLNKYKNNSIQDLNQYATEFHIKRSQKLASVPLILEKELRCNPFLLASDVEEFTDFRVLRNSFKAI